jgi:hypothetical protein
LGYSSLTPLAKDKDLITSGSVLDYTPEKCLDDDGNARCSKPFLVSKSKCVTISWSTEGVVSYRPIRSEGNQLMVQVSHTTAEVRDAGSNEIVTYKDINGDWTPEKGEVRLSLSPIPSSHRAGKNRPATKRNCIKCPYRPCRPFP